MAVKEVYNQAFTFLTHLYHQLEKLAETNAENLSNPPAKNAVPSSVFCLETQQSEINHRKKAVLNNLILLKESLEEMNQAFEASVSNGILNKSTSEI